MLIVIVFDDIFEGGVVSPFFYLYNFYYITNGLGCTPKLCFFILLNKI